MAQFDSGGADSAFAPSHQPYMGPLFNPDPISRDLAITGQASPSTEQEYMNDHGRYLSGLGAHPEAATVDPNRILDREVYDLEGEDDVLGSGIFDPQHRPGTANPDLGVFASNGSLPGFIAREVPFTVSKEVIDITDGASVVSVPAGGLAYVESRGRLVGPAGAPPASCLPANPNQQQPYAYLHPSAPTGWDADSILDQADYPGNPADSDPMMTSSWGRPYAPRPNGPVSPSTFRRPPSPSRPVRGMPGQQRVAPRPAMRVMPRRSIVRATSFGGLDFSGWGPWLVAGLAAGAAIALVRGTKR